jgi:catechol 2,3-dioxygenase-like lactoylglutathione lyase family enzyme
VIKGIHHVAISTPDAERLLNFYGDLLGMKVVYDQSWPPGTEVADAITNLEGSSARQILLRCGNAHVELFEYHAPTPAAGDPDRPVCDHGITHLCLDVEALDAEHERLKAAGVRFHCEPQDVVMPQGVGFGVRTTYARDPDGNVVELQELTPVNSPRSSVAGAEGAFAEPASLTLASRRARLCPPASR